MLKCERSNGCIFGLVKPSPFFCVGLKSCQVRFGLRSSPKCKSENGDYRQPSSWDYPNPKGYVALH